ncbi:MAG: transpeptidase family protein [Bacteroides sp.]|nr:transpeptidase family protein [Bacteroides sp.]
MTRYFFVMLFMGLIGIAIVVKACIIMFVKRQYWTEVADRFVSESKVMKPNRGNIFSSDGKLLASSLPEYSLFVDFKYYDGNEKRQKKGQHRKDSIFKSKLDSICIGLHSIFPETSVATYKTHLRKGRSSQAWQHYPLLPNRHKRINYTQYKQVKELPYFNQGRLSGLHHQEYNNRKRPFGSLAVQTLGRLYADADMGARNGIELAFDTVLKGRDGIEHKEKVMNKYLSIIDVPPVDGCDIVSTIDIDMQDICEKALVDKLKELHASVGVAVLMEVATGEVKAIVNMTRGNDGNYYEMNSNAISEMREPGSTFKTASIMVALEDGHITPETEVNTGNGQMKMYGSTMRDHNWHRGGYGTIDVTRILEVSSNVGVSYLIDKYYKDNPQRFVDGLKRMSIDQPLHLQIRGEGKPYIMGPEDRKKVGRYFAKTSLPWMSIGYETQIPPMNILTFYNAIANNGVMVRPKFVKAAMKDGEVVEEYPTEVINPKICSDKTLRQIQTILERVVSHGLAKPAGSKQFKVSGKTGTAQMSKGATGYKSGTMQYLVSFCGYFPSEAPKYSCIVSIQKSGFPASGGTMAGSVFSKIAERVYAKDLRYDIRNAIDSTTNVIPQVKAGELNEALYVLDELDVPVDQQFEGSKRVKSWGHTQETAEAVVLQSKEMATNTVPNVIGMGAKDAVFLLESKGLHVNLHGVGRVRRQSISGGSHLVKGQTIALTLH